MWPPTTFKLQNKITCCLQVPNFIVYFQFIKGSAKSQESKAYFRKFKKI